MELFETTRKFDPLVLGAYDEEKLCGVLLGVFIHERKGPAKLFSSRFVVYGGPLLKGSDEQKIDCLDTLLKELIKQTTGKALFIQFRNYFSWADYLDVFEKHGFTFLERINYVIQIPGVEDRGSKTKDQKTNIKNPVSSIQHSGTSDQQPETLSSEYILRKFSSSRRRQIKKGLENGAEIIEPKNIDQVREFYNILYKLYRYKVRKPLADWSFFENFYQQTSSFPRPASRVPRPGIGIIRLIRYKDVIIGGILAPVFEDKCIYEWYVCGLDKEYKNQYPSVLATWSAIEYAAKNNIKSFDFMGVGVPETPYGVRDFKARFGGELVNYGRLTRINNQFLYNIAEFGYNVLAILRKI